MIRYLVFAGDAHYPSGGAADFVGCFDDASEAALAMPRGRDWAHVAELHEGRLTIVAGIWDGELKLYPELMAHRAATPDGTSTEAE